MPLGRYRACPHPRTSYFEARLRDKIKILLWYGYNQLHTWLNIFTVVPGAYYTTGVFYSNVRIKMRARSRHFLHPNPSFVLGHYITACKLVVLTLKTIPVSVSIQ